MVKVSKAISVIFAGLILTGCAAPELVKKPTASGKAEGVYPGKTKEQVKDSLVNLCNNKGLMVYESTDSTVICGKQADNAFAQMLVGNAYSTPAVSKIKFTIANVNNSAKVWTDMWLESQMPGGQLNQMPSSSAKDINALQSILDNLKP